MKKRTRNKLLAIATAILLAAVMVVPGIGVLRAEASPNGVSNKYTAITLPTDAIQLKKVLNLPVDANVPVCGFQFQITPGDPINKTSGYFAVLPGITKDVTVGTDTVTYPIIGDITYDATDSKETTTTCTKTTTVDFSNVLFSEPGVYRYVITEAAADNYANVGVGNDEYNQRILDIYIKDINGTLVYDSCTMLKSKSSDAPIGAPSETDNWDATLKSDSFENVYPTNTLVLKKIVTGNQGSRDQYFAFEIKLDSSVVAIDPNLSFGISGQDKTPAGNSATTYSADDMKAANNKTALTGQNLIDGYTIYLQDQDVVTLSGLVKDCYFTITETNDGYAVSTKLTKEGETDINTGTTNVVNGTLDKNTTVEFTNEKDGLIPTGVILSVAPWAIAGIVILAGVVFFAIRSRKKYEEE